MFLSLLEKKLMQMDIENMIIFIMLSYCTSLEFLLSPEKSGQIVLTERHPVTQIIVGRFSQDINCLAIYDQNIFMILRNNLIKLDPFKTDSYGTNFFLICIKCFRRWLYMCKP